MLTPTSSTLGRSFVLKSNTNMPNPEYIQSEQPAIELLSKLGYTILEGKHFHGL